MVQRREFLGLGAATAASVTTSACTSIGIFGRSNENSAELIYLDVPDGIGACAKVLEVRYRVRNGREPRLRQINSSINLNRAAFLASILNNQGDVVDREKLTIERSGVLNCYVPQLNSASCYAAALTSAFRYKGRPVQQQWFIDAANNRCGLGITLPATFPQIITAANFVMTGQHYDFIRKETSSLANILNGGSIQWSQRRQYRSGEILQVNLSARIRYLDFSQNGYWAGRASAAMGIPMLNAPLPIGVPNISINGPDLYHAVNWVRRADGVPNGCMVPVCGTDHLIERFANGSVILMGQSNPGIGHVLVVTKIEFEPSGLVAFEENGSRTFSLNEETKITMIEFMDPATPESSVKKIEVQEGIDDGIDQFLRGLDFVLALDAGVP